MFWSIGYAEHLPMGGGIERLGEVHLNGHTTKSEGIDCELFKLGSEDVVYGSPPVALVRYCWLKRIAVFSMLLGVVCCEAVPGRCYAFGIPPSINDAAGALMDLISVGRTWPISI
ncbi:hypothetical protein C7S18_23900 (plasmid) [Ahniella affigens]|uniref:Uncharacterized protein n=1 Tax=Ahniella affigens TaxID=2021234 RepID=A0A2P1PZW1_9GAMM|nr:hypothetical protein C7S18_23900 [Ahniella affigens]